MKINLSKTLSILALVSLGTMSACTVADYRTADYRPSDYRSTDSRQTDYRSEEAPTASANGKYEDLIQEISCPSDSKQYGRFTDYGYWRGGSWCGEMGREGYWVWLKPTWYVWRTKAY